MKKTTSADLLFLLLMAMFLLPLHPLHGSTVKNRTVNVILAVDETCPVEKLCDFLKNIIADISAEFAKDFSIQFEVEKCVQWNCHDRYHSLDPLFSYFFKTVPKGHADIVIGLTCGKGMKGKYGISFYQEGYVLVRLTDDLSFFKKVLKHEICHLFGATHVNDGDCLPQERRNRKSH
jgi:hypothetical protein